MQTSSEQFSSSNELIKRETFVEWAKEARNAIEVDNPDYIAIDTETEGVAYYDKPFCVTIAWVEGTTGDGNVVSYYLELGIPEVEEVVKEILSNVPNLVFHNAKFDLQKLDLVGLLDVNTLDPEMVWDTECLYHLLDEHGVKRLKVLAKNILNEETDEDEVLKVERRKHKIRKSDGYQMLPRDVLVPYAKKDAEFTIRLFWALRDKVTANGDLLRLLKLEQKLTFTLLRMERRGMGLDLEYVGKATKDYSNRALAQELLIRDITESEEFNPNSPKQIAEFFVAHGIDLPGTDKVTLRNTDHPLAQAILELRSTRKVHGTYLKPMMEEQRDGIIHPSFRQHGTRTGRMSSGGHQAD
jgi:DNA polymerase I-like protein with 3'-5' exonuclease and polymerase domains